MNDRILTGEELKEDTVEAGIRPEKLADYIGQSEVKENLDISAILRTNIDREYRTDTGLSLKYHF